MKTTIAIAILSALTLSPRASMAQSLGGAAALTTAGEGKIHHDIYITLKNRSPAAVAKQLELGKKYLTNMPGEVSFSSGVLAHNLTRHKQVAYLFNDDGFDVAFHLVFTGRTAHDAYQISDQHANHFIPESNPNWTKIRVFDTTEQ